MSDTLQTMLTRAERRHQQQQGNVEFLQVLLEQSAIELGVRKLVVWIADDQTVRMIAEFGDSPHSLPRADVLQRLTSGEVRVLDKGPQSESTAERHLLAASAVAADTRLVIEIVESQKCVDEELLIQLVDVLADLQRRRMLDTMLDCGGRDSAWQAVMAALHNSLDSNIIANTVATDAAAVLSCRRISVAERRGTDWKVIATTGVSQPNERADASRQISAWIQAAAAGRTDDAPAPQRWIRPLTPSGEWSDADWAVVVEADDRIEDTARLDLLLTHASLALANSAAATRSTLMNRVRRRAQNFTRLNSLKAVSVVAVCMAILLFVPAEVRIEVYGELNPAERCFVFAPEDGTVTELHVEEGSEIAEQDVLCVLTNEDLNVRLETIAGELAAANARLAAIDALRGRRRMETTEARLLSAEQAELEVQVRSLARQSAIMTKRLRELHVTARIPGRVYGDRLRQLLFQRPVRRGQYLFEVADPTGGWQLHLKIPEADVRYVLSALQNEATPPEITFSLETSPDVSREASLGQLSLATEVDSRGELSTLAIAEPDDGGLDHERPGSGVVARIHCGRRSAGFVWFRQVIEFVQRHTWL